MILFCKLCIRCVYFCFLSLAYFSTPLNSPLRSVFHVSISPYFFTVNQVSRFMPLPLLNRTPRTRQRKLLNDKLEIFIRIFRPPRRSRVGRLRKHSRRLVFGRAQKFTCLAIIFRSTPSCTVVVLSRTKTFIHYRTCENHGTIYDIRVRGYLGCKNKRLEPE